MLVRAVPHLLPGGNAGQSLGNGGDPVNVVLVALKIGVIIDFIIDESDDSAGAGRVPGAGAGENILIVFSFGHDTTPFKRFNGWYDCTLKTTMQANTIIAGIIRFWLFHHLKLTPLVPLSNSRTA
jgi:hypothetical protein